MPLPPLLVLIVRPRTSSLFFSAIPGFAALAIPFGSAQRALDSMMPSGAAFHDTYQVIARTQVPGLLALMMLALGGLHLAQERFARLPAPRLAAALFWALYLSILASGLAMVHFARRSIARRYADDAAGFARGNTIEQIVNLTAGAALFGLIVLSCVSLAQRLRQNR